MKDHYTEADLLETYYTQPGASMPVMMHLASCAECAAKYDRLDRKLREAAACPTDPAESFFETQRAAIVARISRPQSSSRAATAMRMAAAALLGLLASGVLIYRNEQQRPAPQPAEAVRQVPLEQMPADPWDSEALEEFGEVVQWETWIEGEEPL